MDFYVNLIHRDNLISKLRKKDIDVNLDLKVNQNKSFLQICRNINNKNLITDFYFYEDNLDDNYIIEKWNFEGGTNDPSSHLRIPKTFIYPIKKKTFENTEINIPAFPIYICEFLYGTNWKVKLKKNKDYIIKVIDGKPIHFEIKKKLFGLKHVIKK